MKLFYFDMGERYDNFVVVMAENEASARGIMLHAAITGQDKSVCLPIGYGCDGKPREMTGDGALLTKLALQGTCTEQTTPWFVGEWS